MKIRTLAARERMRVAGLLDGWRLAQGWTAGDLFRDQAETDPGWCDENVFVAIEGDQPVATLTTLPRRLRLLGHDVPTGGFSNLYTEPEWRRRGIAKALVEHATSELRARGVELALAFPGAHPAAQAFFAHSGWYAWGRQQTILRRDPEAAAPPSAQRREAFELVEVTAADARALQSVKSIHAAYAASRSGTVVRDDALWAATIQAGASPREEFWLARRGGLTVAYARASIVDDVLTVTELGRFEDGQDALARLIASLLTPRANDPLAPADAQGLETSAALRSFVILPAFDDIGLIVALEHQGVRAHPMDQAEATMACVNLIGFASRLDVDLRPGEDGAAFLRRILPPDGMVFWPADRF